MKDKAIRTKLLRALHAEGKKRGLDHDDLRFVLRVSSLSDASIADMERVLKEWTGKSIRRRQTSLPRKGYLKTGELQIAGLEEFTTLQNAFAIAGMDGDAQRGFIRRQLRGREEVRTVADFHRVFSGLRAINRRKES